MNKKEEVFLTIDWDEILNFFELDLDIAPLFYQSILNEIKKTLNFYDELNKLKNNDEESIKKFTENYHLNNCSNSEFLDYIKNPTLGFFEQNGVIYYLVNEDSVIEVKLYLIQKLKEFALKNEFYEDMIILNKFETGFRKELKEMLKKNEIKNIDKTVKELLEFDGVFILTEENDGTWSLEKISRMDWEEMIGEIKNENGFDFENSDDESDNNDDE